MIQIDLSNEEKEILQHYFKTSLISLIRLKAQTILMRDHEMKIEEIAYAVVRDERTIGRWIKDFGERRIAGIFSGMVENEHASKLTREQKEEIKKVLAQKPSSYGLPKEFWDVPQLKKYVYARFGMVYETDRSYHFLLEFGNLSFKCFDKFNVKRNEQKIAVRMEQIYGETQLE